MGAEGDGVNTIEKRNMIIGVTNLSEPAQDGFHLTGGEYSSYYNAECI